MGGGRRGFVGRWLDRILGVLPDGGIGQGSRPPDIDGKRDTDIEYRQAVLRAKSQMSSGGQGTTSYEPVDRGSSRD
jgi:hypothetical protein